MQLAQFDFEHTEEYIAMIQNGPKVDSIHIYM